MKKIVVLTSGGDSLGVNVAVRATVRTTIYNEIEVYGVCHGYQGLLNDDIRKLELGSVGDTIQRGGTFLYSAECSELKEQEVRKVAIENPRKKGIEGLIVIDGDGSCRGTQHISEECKEIQTIGIPDTTDNDINGTDLTTGFDTALDTIIDLVDKARDTASNHARTFVIEAVGRDRGDLALWVGLPVSAETIAVPEIKTDIKEMVDKIEQSIRRDKRYSIILVTEGCMAAQDCQKELLQFVNVDNRVSVPDHVRRGGGPTGMDRVLASRPDGYTADPPMQGETVKGVGIKNNRTVATSFDEVFGDKDHKFDYSLYELANELSI